MLNSKTIGNKIANARKKINFSQADLAEKVSISSQAVGKWERGESMPDIATLNKLAEIFGVDLNYFSESFQSVGIDTENKAIDPVSNEMPISKSIRPKALNWNMSSGNWVDADFSGLKNLKEKFASANMKNCKFIGSDLSELMLDSNNIVACDFSNSDLRNSNITSSNITNNNFQSCSLIDTKFSSSAIRNCDFSEADFSGSELKNSEFKNCKIENTKWNVCSFEHSHLSELEINGAMDDCSFDNCSFSKVIFRNVTIRNTFFKGKKLKGIKFVDCQADRLTFEFLKNGKADLEGLKLLD